MRRAAVIVAIAAAACGGASAETSTTSASASTIVTMTPTEGVTVTSSTTATTRPVQDAGANRRASESFLAAMFDQQVDVARLLAAPTLRINSFFSSDDSIDSIAAFASSWGMETIETTCAERTTDAVSTHFACQMVMTDDFSRVAPYTYMFEIDVIASDGFITEARDFEFIDASVTVEGTTKTISDWANEWLLSEYPEADADGCQPAPEFYCGGAFVAHAEEFWAEHPEILAAVVGG